MAPESTDNGRGSPKILYCRCAYANVVPQAVKDEVLQGLCDSGRPFEAVSDLCQMSARRDPGLGPIASGGPVRIAACFERAVRGLFRAAQTPLPAQSVKVLNMRTQTAQEVLQGLLGPEDSR